MLFDVVFYADSEYHGYFARKSIFGSQNREIRVQLFNRLPPISKELISQPWKIISEKTSHQKKARHLIHNFCSSTKVKFRT
jgi:hypothetical protein